MKFNLKSTSSYVLAWLAAAGLAVAFAAASPDDASVMGRLPSFISRTLGQGPITIPDGLPSDRTLALISFGKAQRKDAESWIRGLNLNNDSSISWLRIPVLNDPGSATGRSAAETRLLQHYTAAGERTRLAPLFIADRAHFVRTAGLDSVDHFYAVVVNRRGEVLARVGGQFDADKAQLLRETLQASDL